MICVRNIVYSNSILQNNEQFSHERSIDGWKFSLKHILLLLSPQQRVVTINHSILKPSLIVNLIVLQPNGHLKDNEILTELYIEILIDKVTRNGNRNKTHTTTTQTIIHSNIKNLSTENVRIHTRHYHRGLIGDKSAISQVSEVLVDQSSQQPISNTEQTDISDNYLNFNTVHTNRHKISDSSIFQRFVVKQALLFGKNILTIDLNKITLLLIGKRNVIISHNPQQVFRLNDESIINNSIIQINVNISLLQVAYLPLVLVVTKGEIKNTQRLKTIHHTDVERRKSHRKR